MGTFLMTGLLLGLSAGFAPGPLLTLVVSETLRHGMGAGIKVACAPLLTDLPIILLTLFVLAQLANFQEVLGVISLLGGCFVLWMGYEHLKPQQAGQGALKPVRSLSLVKGMLTNALSPHPYLFWLTVGGPLMNRAMEQGVAGLLAFIVGFYSCLIGAKVLLAVLVGRYKGFLQGRAYRYLMVVLGVLLCGLALLLFYDGWQRLGL